MKRFISIFISLILVITSFTFSASAAEDDFKPVLRFTVASDVHIDDSNSDSEEARLAKLFSASYKYARSQSYSKLDGAFFVGDISNNGSSSSMEKFFDIVKKNVEPETYVRAVLGNHEFYTNSQKAISRFLSASGYSESDIDFTMGGYHFIMLCPENGGRGFTSKQRTWLSNRLAADAAEDPTGTKPIFVFQHHNVKNTVYGSQAWGISDLSSILSSYPQVVDFSGHSHYPINDPRSIWQGSFTALNDGTLSYYEMGIAGVTDSAIYPCDKHGGYHTSRSRRDAAQYYIVEIDKNSAIRVKGYDLLSDTFICEYNITSVGDTSKFTYTNARQEASYAPSFTRSDSITLKGVRTDAAAFEIPQARGQDIIQHYRFELYDRNYNLIKNTYVLSDTFFFPVPERLNCTINGLQPNTDYLVKCYAVNCWEKESNALMLKFRTSSDNGSASCHASPVKPDVFSFIQNNNTSAFDGVSGKELSREGEPLAYTDYVTGRCSAEFNQLNSYQFNDFKNCYSKIRNAVSFEFYGTADEAIRDVSSYVDLFSNQQNGGCGLELSNSGMLEFYVNVGGTYIHPGITVPFGKPFHCVGTYDGRTVKLYVNGVLESYETASGTISFPSDSTSQFLCIGGDSSTNGNTEANFIGKIVTANIYSRALTEYEIEQLYNQYNSFEFNGEKGYKFNPTEKILYGLNIQDLSAQNICSAFNNKNIAVENGKIGTGTEIYLLDSQGNAYNTAQVVIFGDVNGDGIYDATDSIIVSLLANNMLSEKTVGKAVYMAADCNHDG
ncbi:MAG: metallophosphoesterase, partial [Ruminococcus sp.]|nr:metallophosphoesterase [Candidatus Copronaster equi]